ncbi:dynamin family protein [Luedemannella flava]|uniref:Dynamin family protein n=1 Tax=Luedemannella flava TaxID=349316 RepID=A0ABN2M3X3_9ACTN
MSGTRTPAIAGLSDALRGLRAEIDRLRLPLALPSADVARRVVAEVTAQIDDYLLPRLAGLDAPTLAVVGGSTGAGKSTLVNSLVRAPVSRSGVLRPTTLAPTLVCNPRDTAWFSAPELLPSLARSRSLGHPLAPDTSGARRLDVVVAPALAAGLALLDAPDVDSVVAENGELAAELFAAADMWVFVTTASRYADAVPWRLLRDAQDRGTPVAIVLDRVPAADRDAIALHLARMLTEQGLGESPLFTITETVIDGQGLLPEAEVAAVRGWLDRLARDPGRRAEVTWRTIAGAARSISVRANGLARAADEQVAARDDLAGAVRRAYAEAGSRVDAAQRDGSALGGDVLFGLELTASGAGRRDSNAVARGGDARAANVRWVTDRNSAAGPGNVRRHRRLRRRNQRVVTMPVMAPSAEARLRETLGGSLTTLLCEVAERADERVTAIWRANPAGRALLADAGPDRHETRLTRRDRVGRVVRGWHSQVRSLARAGEKGRGPAPAIVALASLGPDPHRPMEAGRGALTEVLAVTGTEPVRQLADQARAGLRAHVGEFLDEEAHGYLALVAAHPVEPATGDRLRAVAASLAAVVRTTRGRPW